MLETFYTPEEWQRKKRYLIVDKSITITAAVCPHNPIYAEVFMYHSNEDTVISNQISLNSQTKSRG